MARGPCLASQSCREGVGRAESEAGSMEWLVVSRADVRGALFGGLWMSWCHSQAAAPNWLVPAISRVGRLGVMEVTDWVVGLTAHNFDDRSNGRYNCPDRAPTVLHVRVSAWVRMRA